MSEDTPLVDLDAIAAGAIETDDIIPEPDGRNEIPKSAPSKGRGRPRKEKTETAPPYRAGMFKQPLMQTYAMIGTMLIPFDQKCGTVILQSAEQCATALDTLAKTNPNVRKVLSTLLQTGAWGTVAAAHAPILIAIATHHVPAVQAAIGKFGATTIPDYPPNES